VARDSAFLLAYCQLAYAHDYIYFNDFDHTEKRLALAETSVRAAVRLQPDSGETHLAQAIHFYWGSRNYDSAQEELAKAARALPNNSRIFSFLGRIDRRQGRWDEAVRYLERALDLDPRNQEILGDLGSTYWALRRNGEATALDNRALALQPQSAFLRAITVSSVEIDANTAPLRAVLNTIEAEGPASAAEVADISFQTALRERDPIAAARALANIPKNISALGNPFPHAWFEGLLAKLRQDAAGAHAAFLNARAETGEIARAQPTNANALSTLARIDAELGEKDKAIREARTACDMLPVSKDAYAGPDLLTNLAIVYALTGEKDLALEQRRQASRRAELRPTPSWARVGLAPRRPALRENCRLARA